MKFDLHLANRFVSDYKLPFPITFKENLFKYYLDLFEEDYQSRTKYQKLCNIVDNQFHANPSEFLEEYYRVREEIIKDILQCEEYQAFNNNCNMQQYEVKDKPQVTSKGVYNVDKIGGTYLSVDIKQANFQALRYVNPKIVKNSETYEDFVRHYTFLQYICESKYTRQVIFGQLNPKRQITVEKYLINEVRKVMEKLHDNPSITLTSMSNDELIYSCDEMWLTMCSDDYFLTINEIKSFIKKEVGVDVAINCFSLSGYNLCFSGSDKPHTTFFVKNQREGETNSNKPWNYQANNSKFWTYQFKGVPLTYFPIAYKLYNNTPLLEPDKHFNYEGMDVIMNEDFKIQEVFKIV